MFSSQRDGRAKKRGTDRVGTERESELESDAVNEFEYKIMVTDAPTASEAQLNGFGKEGWQLATIVPFGGKWYYYFQRIRQPN